MCGNFGIFYSNLFLDRALEGLVKLIAWLSQRHLQKSQNLFAHLIYGVTRNLFTY